MKGQFMILASFIVALILMTASIILIDFESMQIEPELSPQIDIIQQELEESCENDDITESQLERMVERSDYTLDSDDEVCDEEITLRRPGEVYNLEIN